MDPLTDFMTGIETLLFYGSLKGLPKDQIPHAAQSLIQRVSRRSILLVCQTSYITRAKLLNHASITGGSAEVCPQALRVLLRWQ